MSIKSGNITWPDLLNEIYDNNIIQDLSPQVGLLLHAIIYKFSKMGFRNSLCISNIELQWLSNLTPKQFHTFRKELLASVNKKMREEYNYQGSDDFLVYKASGLQDHAGRYFLNYQPILERIIDTRSLIQSHGLYPVGGIKDDHVAQPITGEIITEITTLPYDSEFQEQRKLIIARDEYKCSLCYCENARVCHHIDYNVLNNHESNLITLCPSCHSKTNGTLATRSHYTILFERQYMSRFFNS